MSKSKADPQAGAEPSRTAEGADTANIDQRARGFLKMLVERYLDDGHPVPSKALAEAPGVRVSSATVRNVMAELEARGLVVSPHTSAGKVPTAAGLRFFVDSLIAIQPLDAQVVQRMELGLNRDLAPQALLDTAGDLVAHITHQAALVTLPRQDVRNLRHVEFLPLSEQRVLVILVIDDRDVQNRIIHTGRDFTEDELTAAANVINQHFAGHSLTDVRGRLLRSLHEDKERLDELMQTALDLASRALDDTPDAAANGLLVAGEAQLLQAAGPDDMDTLRELFAAFARKRDILHLLDRCLQSDGVQLFIGGESGYQVLDDYSVVTAPYAVNGQVAGVLGVIGPKRMPYQQVIPTVDVTARLLGAALTFH